MHYHQCGGGRASQRVLFCTPDVHQQGNLPKRDVRAKAAEDFDGVPFLYVWIIYDGMPVSLDIPVLNSYDSFL